MIGVIADDLSGAAEIGAIGLRHGLRAEVVLGSVSRLRAARRGRPAKAGTPNADLVCIDTDSRACAPKEAGRRAAAAAKRLRKAGAKRIYKKVDSVLRGNVLAEIEALAKVLGYQRILLHPANPSLGRMIRDENYFIHGQPIHQTEFARDPAYPRWTADVRALLNGGAANLIQVCKPRDPLPEEGIVICESTSARDVRLWAGRPHTGTLLAGGAEFFAALLALRGARTAMSARNGKRASKGKARADSAVRAPQSRELFVCGSTSESSKKFIGAARRAGTPVFSLPEELARGADFTRAAAQAISEQVAEAFESRPRVILQIGLRTIREAPVARKLAGHLTRLARAVINRMTVSRVYVEGGATAVDLVRRMGWTRLEVVREVAPGVATLAVNGDHALQVTIKPGTYVWPDEIQKSPATKIL